MQNNCSIYLPGFWKNHDTQHVLLKMIETWKIKLNPGHKVGVIHMNLSKSLDSLNLITETLTNTLWIKPNCN